MRRRILLVLAAGLACAVGATTAASAGGPSPGISQGWDGVARGNERYVSIPAGASTSIQVINREGGRVVRFMKIEGTWGIPLVDFHGTTEGLFPDGRTLLLAQSVYTGQGLRQNTSFKLVDIKRMKVLRTIRLRGAMAFDAVSPDTRYIYLVEYVSEDSGLYRVRAYDLNRNKLLAKIVADRRSWETGMQGSPVSRLWKDGWAYTLYGGNARPFIHALDTRHVEAVCINMPWKTVPQRLFDYRLHIDGAGHLVVRGPHGRALVVIDRKTFRVLSSVRNP
jgi:DNA-binding beta-propeller fold protein YncE